MQYRVNPKRSKNVKNTQKLYPGTCSFGKFITTNKGFGLRYNTNEVPITGLRGSGVKAINLKDDFVISGRSFTDAHYVTIITDKNTAKRIKIEEFEPSTRARKGLQVVRDVKTNPYHILNSFMIKNKVDLGIITSETNYLKITDIPICDRYQTGSTISKEQIEKAFIKQTFEKGQIPEEIDVSLDKVDEKMMTIDDFLGDLKID